MSARDFGFLSFVRRFGFALLVVLATYNPTGYSYYHWIANDVTSYFNGDAPASTESQEAPQQQASVEKNFEYLPLKALLGVLLLVGWVICLSSTWVALGPFGMVLALAFFGVLVWMAIDWGWLKDDSKSIAWMIEFVTVGVLATGMSWSFIRLKLSGQYEEADQ